MKKLALILSLIALPAMAADNLAMRLHDAVEKVAPIDGVSLESKRDKSTWRIDFKKEATQKQKDAAQKVIDEFEID